jgi:ABC-2 type transport system permease protein
MTHERAAGAIYDLGYQSYSGARRGRLYGWWRLVTFSLRAAFGASRTSQSRFVPRAILALVFVPAIVRIGIAAATTLTQVINYASHLQFTGLLVGLFAAAQAPELIVTDRQHGVLSLYFSRPVTGVEYAFAKITALVAAILILTLGPEILLFLGKVFIDQSPWAALATEWHRLGPILGGTFAMSAFTASIGLAISSFASRRSYATASVIAFFMLLPAAASIVGGVAGGSVRRYTVLFHPFWLLNGFVNWLFDVQARARSPVARAELPGAAYLYVILGVTIAATLIVLLRYRKGEP